jgi:hypothetical protein
VPGWNHREVGGIQRTLCTLTFCKYRTRPRRDTNPLKATRCSPSKSNDRALDPSATDPPSLHITITEPASYISHEIWLVWYALYITIGHLHYCITYKLCMYSIHAQCYMYVLCVRFTADRVGHIFIKLCFCHDRLVKGYWPWPSYRTKLCGTE